MDPVELERAGPAAAGAGPAPVLEVEELSFDADRGRVLDSISFSLAPGELVVVMGASGSGKTTLLKCVNRLLEPSGGRVLLEGSDVTGIAPTLLRRRIGMVWQVPFMFKGTVGDNLRRAADYAGTTLGEHECASLLTRAAFDGDPGTDASRLSIGQQQRVAVARALVGRPSVLLCDEPTASLDHSAALRLEATLREMCADGMAVVFVTHDEAQADRVARRRLQLGDGRLTESGVAPPGRPAARDA